MTAVLDWRADALCTQMPTEMFFPEPHNHFQVTPLAKAACSLCPVKNECLAVALENREEYGIFGGLSPIERSALLSPPLERFAPHPQRRRHKRRKAKGRATPQHGTLSGFSRHRRDGESACDPCRLAQLEYQRSRHAKKKAVNDEGNVA